MVERRHFGTWPVVNAHIGFSLCIRLTSGHPTADQPDGHGNEQHRQREQPAALDPLERPEVAGRLVVRPLRVAVLGETRRWAKGALYGYSAARSRNERRKGRAAGVGRHGACY